MDYLVKWRNFPHNQWVPAEKIKPGLIETFEKNSQLDVQIEALSLHWTHESINNNWRQKMKIVSNCRSSYHSLCHLGHQPISIPIACLFCLIETERKINIKFIYMKITVEKCCLFVIPFELDSSIHCDWFDTFQTSREFFYERISPSTLGEYQYSFRPNSIRKKLCQIGNDVAYFFPILFVCTSKYSSPFRSELVEAYFDDHKRAK